MSRRYNRLWPEQAKAKWLVQKKVQRGEIVKPDRCQKCGEPFPKEKLQAHHHDYRKPVEVRWYCDACHKEIHRELGHGWKDWAVTQVISLEVDGYEMAHN